MPPVAGTLSAGHSFAFLFALLLFLFPFLFVVVFVLLPVASGLWAGGSLLLRLWLRIVILLPVASGGGAALGCCLGFGCERAAAFFFHRAACWARVDACVEKTRG